MRNMFTGVSKGDENATTELLANLMATTYIRDIILECFGIESRDSIKAKHISTQTVLNDGSRPDLTIQNQDAYILVENKIRYETTLQTTQTTSYLKAIKSANHKHRKLIFLIPPKYAHRESLDEFRSREPCCNIITWDVLLKTLQNKEVHSLSPVVAQAIDHLCESILPSNLSMALSREEIIFMLSPQELSNANKLLNKSSTFIRLSVEAICQELGEKFTCSDDHREEYVIGKHINYNNVTSIFIGYDFGLTEKHPEHADYTFSLQIKNDAINCCNLNNDNHFFYKENGSCCFKLNKFNYTNFENPAAFIDEVASLIKKFIA